MSTRSDATDDVAHRARVRRLPLPKWFAPALLGLAVGLIALATLTPGSSGGGGGPVGCFFICGSRGGADTMANILLFLPFGFALGSFGFNRRRALLVGILASFCIEGAQLSLVAGRDSNLADITSNAIGAVLGAHIGRSFLIWLIPSARAATRRLGMAALGVLATVAATGVLLSPAMPPEPYYGQWAETRGQYQRYPGLVVSAAVGSEPVPIGGMATPGLRHLLLSGEPLRVSLEAGPITLEPSQIVRIADANDDIIFVGAEGVDLVLHYRSLSDEFWLDQPTVRLRGALAEFTSGSEFEIMVWRERTGFCLSTGAAQKCPTFTPASGWALLQNVNAYPRWFQTVLSLAWAAFLAFPLGLWYRRNRASNGMILIVVIGVLAAPLTVGLVPVGTLESAAAVAGFLLGGAAAAWGAGWLRRFGDPVLAGSGGPGGPTGRVATFAETLAQGMDSGDGNR